MKHGAWLYNDGKRAWVWALWFISIAVLGVSLLGCVMALSMGEFTAGPAVGWRHVRGDHSLLIGGHLFEGDEVDRYVGRDTDEFMELGNGWHLHEHPLRRFLGFTVMIDFPNAPEWYFIVGAPFWFILLLSGGALYWSTSRIWAAPVLGRCTSCGYDLRATPDRCPECGTPVKVPAPPAPPP